MLNSAVCAPRPRVDRSLALRELTATISMALVSYSDSEGSEDEEPRNPTRQNEPTAPTTQPSTSFAVDKSNPRKIQVKLQETKVDASGSVGAYADEPSPKRQRIGRGTFGGFNSMLPAPKRENKVQNASVSTKGQPRKIFSLKTGAERGFDRESDAELRQLFAEQHADLNSSGRNRTENEHPLPVSHVGFVSPSASIPPTSGAKPMFKPLSVARKPPKKISSTRVANTLTTEIRAAANPAPEEIPQPAPKVNLFSTNVDLQTHAKLAAMTAEYQPLVYEVDEENRVEPNPDVISEEAHTGGPGNGVEHGKSHVPNGPQSLDTIASDLNLSASARRQLFGRKPGTASNAVNVINFNTDQEYAANEVLRASGEQVQHNPVRAPPSGKHSLKQLVSMATGQKDALEESFAAGRQNKKEAGSRYGW